MIRRIAMLAPMLVAALSMALSPMVSAVGLSGDALQLLKQDAAWVDRTPPTVACGTGANIPNGDAEQNGRAIYDFLVGKGLKPFQAAGVLGNMMAESGLFPQRLQNTPASKVTTAEEAVNASVAWGIVQFDPPSKFIRYSEPDYQDGDKGQGGNQPTAKAPYTNANNLGTQLTFLWEQLEGRTSSPEGIPGRDIRRTTSLEEAVLAFQGGPQQTINGKTVGPYYGYERPKDKVGTVKDRFNNARGALTKYGSGAPAGGEVEPGAAADAIGTGPAPSCDASGAEGDGASADGWVWPVKANIRTGNCWGVQVSGLGRHAGMDINSTVNGNEAVAAHTGTVVKVFKDYNRNPDPNRFPAGNYVMVKADTSPAVWYAYQHLASVSVNVGDKVTPGQKIGIIGRTGRVFGAPEGHLHFTVATTDTLGSYSNSSSTRDPMDYLPKDAPGNYKCKGDGSNPNL